MDFQISPASAVILAIVTVWEIAWKGVALWKAAHRDHGAWFVALPIFNTAGVLPIAYILLNGKEKTT